MTNCPLFKKESRYTPTRAECKLQSSILSVKHPIVIPRPGVRIQNYYAPEIGLRASNTMYGYFTGNLEEWKKFTEIVEIEPVRTVPLSEL